MSSITYTIVDSTVTHAVAATPTTTSFTVNWVIPAGIYDPTTDSLDSINANFTQDTPFVPDDADSDDPIYSTMRVVINAPWGSGNSENFQNGSGPGTSPVTGLDFSSIGARTAINANQGATISFTVTIVNGPGWTDGLGNPVSGSLSHFTLQFTVTKPDIPTGPPLSVDVHERSGAIAAAWTTPGQTVGALYTSVHLAPTKVIGSGATGWEPKVTVESAHASAEGLCWLANDRLWLGYYQSAAGGLGWAYRTSNDLGLHWSGLTSIGVQDGRVAAGGRALLRAWRYRVISSGPNYAVRVDLCTDNRGAWVSQTNVASLTVSSSQLVGGAFSGNQFGMLYQDSATSKVYWTTSVDLVTWSAGADTGFTGFVLGMARLDVGRMMALVNHSGTIMAIVSDDRGRTWQQASSDIGVPANTVIIPAACRGIFMAVYIDGVNNRPVLWASVDGGVTWT